MLACGKRTYNEARAVCLCKVEHIVQLVPIFLYAVYCVPAYRSARCVEGNGLGSGGSCRPLRVNDNRLGYIAWVKDICSRLVRRPFVEHVAFLCRLLRHKDSSGGIDHLDVILLAVHHKGHGDGAFAYNGISKVIHGFVRPESLAVHLVDRHGNDFNGVIAVIGQTLGQGKGIRALSLDKVDFRFLSFKAHDKACRVAARITPLDCLGFCNVSRGHGLGQLFELRVHAQTLDKIAVFKGNFSLFVRRPARKGVALFRRRGRQLYRAVRNFHSSVHFVAHIETYVLLGLLAVD